MINIRRLTRSQFVFVQPPCRVNPLLAYTVGMMRRFPIMRITTSVCGVALLLAGLTLVGCKASPPHANTQTLPSDQYRAVFDAAQAVLTDQGFTLDRTDYRFGMITTQPQQAPTVFEPWVNTHTTRELGQQATTLDLRRTVRVELAPDDATEATHRVRVEVFVEQRQHPNRRLTHTAGRNVFSSLRDTPAELQARGITGSYWQPLGRDPQLETQLLHAIQNHP